MSGGVTRSRFLTYLAGFVCALGAIAVLGISGLTRSLSAGYSMTAIVLAVAAMVLGVLAMRP